ncbi:hypothetical protein C8R45DRAFT_458209 [Mycena sanguinolenta]|nr:hypothetical protein C8R45DRAFT_458209 [Mycena sanguinolenta]
MCRKGYNVSRAHRKCRPTRPTLLPSRCKTTAVQRGRPRKVDEISSPPPTSEPQPSASSSRRNNSLNHPSTSSAIAPRPRVELSDTPDLSPELVKHLFDCLHHFPECRHPLFHLSALRAALNSASYKLHLLPPPARVLATCACALVASISFHPAIIGPSSITSLTDPTVFCAGADLREYGVRRAPMYRALCARAVALACEERVHLDVSKENAVACFLLDVLERLNAAPTRPWAVSYVSHTRILAGYFDTKPRPGFWNGFMMAETLASMARRTSVSFTYNDQLLLSGSEPPSLEQLLQSLQTMAQASKKVSHVAFPALWPFMFHFIRLARDLYDKISGDYARRHPLAEPALLSLLSSLSHLQSILALILTHPDLSSAANGDLLFYDFPGTSPSKRREADNVRSCAFAMSVAFTGLVMGVWKEVKHRVQVADADADASSTTTATITETTSTATTIPTPKTAGTTAATATPTMQTRWAHDRLRTLERQVRELAGLAVGDVGRTVQLLPSLPHLAHLDWICVPDWADFCLAEAAEKSGVDATRARVMEIFISALKLFGYCCEIPRSDELIAQMEVYVAPHRLSDSVFSLNNHNSDSDPNNLNADPNDLNADPDSTNASSNSSPNSNNPNTNPNYAGAFAQLFPFDNSWAGMFDDLDGVEQYNSSWNLGFV